MDILIYIVLFLSVLSAGLLFAIFVKIGKKDEAANKLSQELQDRISSSFDSFRSSLEARLQAMDSRISDLSVSLRASLDALNASEKRQMELLFTETREFNEKRMLQEKETSESLRITLDTMRKENQNTMESVLKESASLIEKVRVGMDAIRTDNNKQLEVIRGTVDEKLQKTLETRISASFQEVTKNLESLYKSIGEMNSLTKDIGNLNRMFSNVKVRGTWGEVQAETILSDMLTPQQYVKNFSPGRGKGVVEFAIRLPGKENGSDVYLPIDSKFPKEDFVRYSNAAAEGNDEAMNAALKDLRQRVLAEAREIRDKYIVPPVTTDFAILFVPTESLYAELLRTSGFVETLQESCKVVLTGPTNFAALINSLQIGFRTLQVEKNTEKIWKLFRDLKTQFSRFGEDLEKSQRALDAASDKIEAAVRRSNTISGKLERIELPDQNGDVLEVADNPSLIE
ncbi:MAG: DNA recombination protein RmuC [Spirochaetes bacterium]|uniref:DNA recombination protein RmuC n=1 Tax=Candidatus Ornithospirochaeta stercoripullorum TaxID=2840899 RepID=A0A9D9H2V1_9SPIO|nr:DNA recombination protein RmuC [Candidatus Ornithospirochaeta stercoripullorum]